MSKVFRKASQCVIKKTGNEYILVPITDNIASMNAMYTMNESGAFIWEHIDGLNSTLDIAEKLTEEYEIDKDTAVKDVHAFTEKIAPLLFEV